MERYSLTLTPSGGQSFAVTLSEKSSRHLPIDRIIDQIDDSYSVFSDLSYEFRLFCSCISDVQNVLFYVNDCFEPCRYQDGIVHFPAKRRIFLDCYGFVEISMIVQFVGGAEVHLYSAYLPVLVKKGFLNDSVKAMADYIYDNQQELLLHGEMKPKNTAELKESDYKSLESQIILAKEITTLYENSYGYFKANCRFKTEKADIVDNFEKLQYITPKTLQYTVQHPEQLRQTSGTIGIRILNKTYHPEKTMITQNIYSKDIYENRVVVGFLKTMIMSVQMLIYRIDDLLIKFPIDKTLSNDYVYSPSYIYSGTKRLLNNGRNDLILTLRRLELLWGLYCNAMQIVPEKIEHMPRPTAIFLSVPQYNKIFIHIHKWLSFGIYDLNREYFMLSFVKISFLYENYLLSKLINYFKSSGLQLAETKKCSYQTLDRWKYKNTFCNNTFIFSNHGQEITLYYQPVIFDSDKSLANGIGLYRNNTISINSDADDERRGHYYVPDFILKVNTGNINRYVICDAKFSSASTIRNYYIPDLAYKYLFSISPISENDIISGLCIIYGQCTEASVLLSVYDKEQIDYRIEPFAEMLPLIEGIGNESHYKNIGKVFAKLLDLCVQTHT